MDYLPHLSNSPWLTYHELVPDIMNVDCFKKNKQRGNIRVSARACKGVSIYVEYESLPSKYQALVKEKYGDPKKYIAIQPLKQLLRTDDVARQWFATYKLPNGRELPLPYQLKYARSCDWLNLISLCLKDKKYLKDKLGIGIVEFWDNVATLVRNDEVEHDLPGSVDRLRDWHNRYKNKGYECMLSDAYKLGNDFARKVSPKIEQLIVSLYCMPHKPYMAEVCKLYKQFMDGKLAVVDVCSESGGEIFNPLDFYIPAPGQRKKASKGEAIVTVPYVLGESTVDYYLKQPANEAIVNKMRMKGQDFNAQYRPSVKRIAPFYALSKITMDDIDLPFKGPDGERIVKSYQIFDVASEAVVGVAFSEDKNKELIMEALRDMFRMIIRRGWGIPWEIEMERHLTSAMKGKYVKQDDTDEAVWMNDIFTPGVVFPATRICQSAQAKRAEGFIKKKKYGFQKKRPGFQGRFYAKLLTNRLNTDEKQLRFEYEQIVDCELQDIAAYNNELHPKQDLYPGLTRWQVLENNQNPNLAKYQAHQVIQFIGYSTATSIRAGVARVQYGDYMLPDMALLKDMTYNGEIMAYYLPDDNGIVQSVYLYEDGQYLCEAVRKVGFQEAEIEQTDEDRRKMVENWKPQAQFDKLVKDGKANVIQVGVTEHVPKKGAVRKPVKVLAPAEEQREERRASSFADAKQSAINDI